MSAPSLSWDAMLKMNEIEIELTPDPDMYIFFEKGTRGGISYIFNSYRGASKKWEMRFEISHLKWEQKQTERGGSPSMCVRSLF